MLQFQNKNSVSARVVNLWRKITKTCNCLTFIYNLPHPKIRIEFLAIFLTFTQKFSFTKRDLYYIWMQTLRPSNATVGGVTSFVPCLCEMQPGTQTSAIRMKEHSPITNRKVTRVKSNCFPLFWPCFLWYIVDTVAAVSFMLEQKKVIPLHRGDSEFAWNHSIAERWIEVKN